MHGKNRRAGLGRLPDQTGVVRLSFELASEGWAASGIAVQLAEIDIYRTAWGVELCERRADLGQQGVHGNTRDWVKKSSHRKRRNQDG